MTTTAVEQSFLLRDVFNPAAVGQLADNIARAWPVFDRVEFVATITSQLDALNFGGRNVLIRDTLQAYLPPAFPEAVQILLDALAPRSRTAN